MIVRADQLCFSSEEVAVRIDAHGFGRQAGNDGAALYGERLNGLLHGQRQSDEFKRDVDAAARGTPANRRDWILDARVDRSRTKRLAQSEPSHVEVDGKHFQRAKCARKLNRGHAESSGAVDGHGLSSGQTTLSQRMQRRRG